MSRLLRSIRNFQSFGLFNKLTLCTLCFISIALGAVYPAITNRVYRFSLFWVLFYLHLLLRALYARQVLLVPYHAAMQNAIG